MIQELSLSTDFTPFTVFIFFINTFNILVSRINTVKLPWKSPSTESILNDLSVTPDSLLITDVMLVTMAISSLPTTALHTTCFAPTSVRQQDRHG